MTKRCYATLGQLTDPGYLGNAINDLKYNTTLLRMLENASEEIDGICFRHFYVYEGSKYFDGSGSTFLSGEDILDISTFQLDLDGDQTYETNLNSSHYHLYPLNEYPKTYARLNNSANVGSFAGGIRAGCNVTGNFGYGDGESANPYFDSGVTGTITTGTTVTLSAEGTIEPGHTIRCDSEQMYVKSVSSNGANTAVVDRAQNGTSSANHSAATAYIYQYPGPVVEATLILATAWWKQRENPTTFMAGDSVTGQYTISKDINNIIRDRLDDLVKRHLV